MPQEIAQHTLDNGLTVLLRPLPASGTISTWIFYRVGARNESPGQTGISHWVEHMVFKGTPTFDKGAIARQVNRLGGVWNGLTQYDWTAYFETLPAQHWDLALRIESERMTQARFDPDEVEAERTVVLAEREAAENAPSFLLHEELSATALRVHPYRQPVIGWKEDLQRITGDELRQHYRTYYAPNNALLVVTGAIDPQEALAAVEEHLGSIEPVAAPPQVRIVEPAQQTERRLILRRPGSTPIIEVAFPAPRGSDPDFIPFLVLDAVLSGTKGLTRFGGGPATFRTSRLYRALVETERAIGVRSFLQFSLDPGLFTIRAMLRDGQTPEAVEPIVLEELDNLIQTPPDPAELARTVRQVRAQLAYGSESSTAQAYWLGSLAIVDRPERADTLLDEFAAVRPEDVQRVAADYLTTDRRTVGWFVPTESPPGPIRRAARPRPEGEGQPVPPLAAPPGPDRDPASAVEARSVPFQPAANPVPGGGPCPLPAGDVDRRQLPGGTVLLVREHHFHPVAAVHGYVHSGSMFDPAGQEGLAQLTAAMLSRGTERRSFRQIHEDLEGIGAGMDFGTGLHATVFSGKSLAEDLPRLLELLVDMLRRPAFPEAQWRRLQGETLTRLRRMHDSPNYVANRAFRRLLYPEGHAHRRPAEGTAASVSAIEREALAAFHRQHFHPDRLVITVTGDVRAGEVEARLTDLLDGWETPSSPVEEPEIPRRPPLEEIRRTAVAIPGKRQASLVWGVPGLARTDPDYYAALVANTILGRLGLMGRLGAALRDEQGLVYAVHSNLEAGPSAGPWTVRAGVAPGQVDRAVRGIVEQIERFLEQGPKDDELADAITYLVGQVPLRLETNDGVAATLLSIERFGLGLDFVERYPDILRTLSHQEIVETARRYLSTEGYALAMAGPVEA